MQYLVRSFFVRHNFILLNLLVFTLLPMPARAQLSDNEIINRVSSEAMLGQKIAKNYLMIAADIKKSEAQQQLDESFASFELKLAELQENLNDADTLPSQKALKGAWDYYRTLIARQPSRDNIESIINQSDMLTIAANQLTSALQVKLNRRNTQLINLSSQQQVLSQRIAKLYLALYLNSQINDLDGAFNQALSAYDEGLNNLLTVPENTTEISDYLAKVKIQWEFSKTGFQHYKAGKFTPIVITTTTDAMLQKMEVVTHEYQHIMQAQNTLASLKLDF